MYIIWNIVYFNLYMHASSFVSSKAHGKLMLPYYKPCRHEIKLVLSCTEFVENILFWWNFEPNGDRRGHHRMVVGFTTIYAISTYRHSCCEFESQSGWGVQHHVIKFVSDLWQVVGFLRVLEISLKVALNTIKQTNHPTFFWKTTSFSKEINIVFQFNTGCLSTRDCVIYV